MSLNRFAPKRDANEPAIRKRFAHHGWHTEQRSSAGGWDLDAYPPSPQALGFTRVVHVDVKMPDGKVTKAQEKKWAELHAKGIPVYVVRTEADVDALVKGELAAWERRLTRDEIIGGVVMRKRPRKARAKYTPPRSKPIHDYNGQRKTNGDGREPCTCGAEMDAAKEAEETFAPSMCKCPTNYHRRDCPLEAL